MSMVNPLWGCAPHPRRTATRVLLPSRSKPLLNFTLSARHPDHRTDRRRTMDDEPRERLERKVPRDRQNKEGCRYTRSPRKALRTRGELPEPGGVAATSLAGAIFSTRIHSSASCLQTERSA